MCPGVQWHSGDWLGVRLGGCMVRAGGCFVLTLVRSTPVRALTETGSSANRRLTSPVTRLPSPLRMTISLVLARGAATLPAIWSHTHTHEEVTCYESSQTLGRPAATPHWRWRGSLCGEQRKGGHRPWAEPPGPGRSWQRHRTAGRPRPSASSSQPRPFPPPRWSRPRPRRWSGSSQPLPGRSAPSWSCAQEEEKGGEEEEEVWVQTVTEASA